ncbi:MAG: InlB B-repeat-containing protein [Defluviitaleaceae bacterium]|nr:InlB B-repeat-containing protein [Defluviitaleaceae bacterium]
MKFNTRKLYIAAFIIAFGIIFSVLPPTIVTAETPAAEGTYAYENFTDNDDTYKDDDVTNDDCAYEDDTCIYDDTYYPAEAPETDEDLAYDEFEYDEDAEPILFEDYGAAFLSAVLVADFSELQTAIANEEPDIIIQNNIVFDSAITISHDVIFTADSTVQLTVNGNFRHFNVIKNNGGNVRMEFSNVELVGQSPAQGGGIMIARTPHANDANLSNTIGTLYLYNAIIRNVHNTSSHGGAVSFTWPQGEIAMTVQNLVVRGNNTRLEGNSSTRGGAISANHVTIYAGVFNNNTTTQRAGGINAHGNLTMYGGTISNNHSVWGGGVEARHGNVILYGGIITGNSATQNGGGVRTISGYLSISGDAVISHNTAIGNGGGIDSAVTYMHGGTITNNQAHNGGGIYANNFTMTGGNIQHNNAEYGGGVSIWGIVIPPTVNFQGDFTMTGGNIRNNTAIYGGGIHIGENTTAAILNGVISDNTAIHDGGGIFTHAHANLTTGNVTFTRNTAQSAAWPSSIWPNIPYAVSSSIIGSSGSFLHPLNNFDINYAGTPITFHILTFNANGGTGGPHIVTIIENTPVTIITPNTAGITRPGFTFTGWNTAADGSGTTYAPGASITLNTNLTLFAQWEETPSEAPPADNPSEQVTSGGSDPFRRPSRPMGGPNSSHYTATIYYDHPFYYDAQQPEPYQEPIQLLTLYYQVPETDISQTIDYVVPEAQPVPQISQTHVNPQTSDHTSPTGLIISAWGLFFSLIVIFFANKKNSTGWY